MVDGDLIASGMLEAGLLSRFDYLDARLQWRWQAVPCAGAWLEVMRQLISAMKVPHRIVVGGSLSSFSLLPHQAG